MSTPALNPLVTKVRGMHPGAYDDMDDATLTKAVLKKYPQYSDLAAPAFNPNRTPAAGTMHPSFLLGDENGDATPQSLGDTAKGMVRNLADVSAPVLAHRIGQKIAPKVIPPGDLYQGEGQLKDVPEKATMMVAGGLEGGAEGEAAPRIAPRASVAASAAAAEGAGPGVAMRLGKVLAHRIPGVKLAGDLVDAVRGPETKTSTTAPAPLPKPPTPETNGIPWGSGGQGPLDLRGQRIPAPQPRPAEPPSPTGLKIDHGTLQKLLNESLGVKELPPQQPGVPIRNQMPAHGEYMQRVKAMSGQAITNGHTPVDSSAMRSYKYDPQAQEFHAHMKTAGDTVHVFGDVRPEEADAFGTAESKGKAFQSIKQSHPLVAKIINGKRLPVGPGAAAQ